MNPTETGHLTEDTFHFTTRLIVPLPAGPVDHGRLIKEKIVLGPLPLIG